MRFPEATTALMSISQDPLAHKYSLSYSTMFLSVQSMTPPYLQRLNSTIRRRRRRCPLNSSRRWVWEPTAAPSYTSAIIESPPEYPASSNSALDAFLVALKYAVNAASASAKLTLRPLIPCPNHKTAGYSRS